MGTTLMIILMAALVQSEHVDEDKLTLMAAASSDDNLQKIDVKEDRVEDAEVLNVTRKLKEFEDHAELQKKISSPSHPAISPTPSPKIVVDVLTTSEEVRKDENSTALPEILPTPIPVQLNPITDAVGTVDKEVYLKHSTKKPSVVGKKGVVYEEPSVVGKKGADPENLKPSVTARKGADPKTKRPSVTPRKEAVPPLVVDLDKTKVDNITTISNSTDVVPVTETDEINAHEKGRVTSEKFKATDLNMLTVEKEKNVSQLPSEFNMKLSPGSSRPVSVNNVTVLSSSSVRTPTVEQVGSEPVKPPTADPLTTEAVTTTVRFKPTAATDSLENTVGDSKTDSMSYTPAVVGIVLLLAIVITVIIVGYRRLQDIWMRRHYARMDFLIDGMYDV